MALSTSGRSMVTRAMWPSIANRTGISSPL
jgi:hypothetical protein